MAACIFFACQCAQTNHERGGVPVGPRLGYLLSVPQVFNCTRPLEHTLHSHPLHCAPLDRRTWGLWRRWEFFFFFPCLSSGLPMCGEYY